MTVQELMIALLEYTNLDDIVKIEFCDSEHGYLEKDIEKEDLKFLEGEVYIR